MFIIGIIGGLIGAAIGIVAGLVGGFFGLFGFLRGLAGAASPLIPVATIALGVIWLIKSSNSDNTAKARAGRGPYVPPPNQSNPQ